MILAYFMPAIVILLATLARVHGQGWVDAGQQFVENAQEMIDAAQEALDSSNWLRQSYIIEMHYVLPDAVEVKLADWLVGDTSAEVLYIYRRNVIGVALANVDRATFRRISADPYVLHIEQDNLVKADQGVVAAQENVNNWGLDRIDQYSSDSYDRVYHYYFTGAGVTVFTMDTGVRSDHHEFEGRVSCAANFVPGESCEDQNGHGTVRRYLRRVRSIYSVSFQLFSPTSSSCSVTEARCRRNWKLGLWCCQGCRHS